MNKEQKKSLNVTLIDLIKLFNLYASQGDRFENIKKIETILVKFKDCDGEAVTKIHKLRREDYATVYESVKAAFEGEGEK